MGKRLISIKVEEEIWKEAKEVGLNVSKICENALKEAVKRLKTLYPQEVTPLALNGPPGQRHNCEGEKDKIFNGGPNGTRTRVSGVRGQYPRPLDDGTIWLGDEDSNPGYEVQSLASYR